jgi:hypothetical protein
MAANRQKRLIPLLSFILDKKISGHPELCQYLQDLKS